MAAAAVETSRVVAMAPSFCLVVLRDWRLRERERWLAVVDRWGWRGF